MELDIDTTWPTRFSERRGARFGLLSLPETEEVPSQSPKPPGRYKIDKIRPEEKEVYLKFERPSPPSPSTSLDPKTSDGEVEEATWRPPLRGRPPSSTERGLYFAALNT